MHLNNHEVLLMPDPWEYPWFAAWDLAFHCVTLAHIDPAFAKSQLILLLREWYMHPNGQIPAYEWNFSDVNPPVHAWAALRVFELDGGTRLRASSSAIFHKLLDQLHLVDEQQGARRQQPLPGRVHGAGQHRAPRPLEDPAQVGYLEQADSTAWMAMYALDLLEIALRLALDDRSFEDVATKFFEHFLRDRARGEHVGPVGRGGRASSTTSCTWPTAATSRSRCARWSASCRSPRLASTTRRQLALAAASSPSAPPGS